MEVLFLKIGGQIVVIMSTRMKCGKYAPGEIPGLAWNLRWHGIGSRKPKLAMTYFPLNNRVAQEYVNFRR